MALRDITQSTQHRITLNQRRAGQIKWTLKELRQFKKERNLAYNTRRRKVAEELKRHSLKFKCVPMQTILKILERAKAAQQNKKAENYEMTQSFTAEVL